MKIYHKEFVLGLWKEAEKPTHMLIFNLKWLNPKYQIWILKTIIVFKIIYIHDAIKYHLVTKKKGLNIG